MNKRSVVKKMIHFLLITALVFLAACSSNSAGNKDNGLPSNYPDKPIDWLVGFVPGGTIDLTARQASKILNEQGIVSQPFVIKNMPGGGGALAFQELKKRKNDPYVLVGMYEFGDPIWKGIGIEPSDIKPIIPLVASEVLVIVRKDSPYKTIEELLDALKSNPDLTISISSAIDGVETFYWDQIRQAYGIKKINYVPTGGGSESLTRLLGGQVDATLGIPSNVQDYIKTGDIRVLAVLSEKRSESFPDVPTLKEKGIDLVYKRTYGLVTGGEVPDATVDFWFKALKKVIETEEWKKMAKQRHLEIPTVQSPEEYYQYYMTSGEQYQKYVNSLKK
ncbi:Bug family tripartite tricarboxylate transporter substrate binding protein [Brevibacillus sp. H7]|uniref:Bug family tripartite tricarboxylate transporter substrate binding protein n=1 Tax=Brevibacillus sp. H7 TaxID=3349138 RepID=UPI003830CF37